MVFFRPSCFLTKHRLQEFGIGRSPTHRVVFRSFPFLLCKLSKQTNKHFTFLPSCFHVALYSTLVAHRLIFVRFLCSKFSNSKNMLSTRSLGNCSQSLLALPSRDLKRFVPENFCQEGSMQVINDILQEFSKLAILQKKRRLES